MGLRGRLLRLQLDRETVLRFLVILTLQNLFLGFSTRQFSLQANQ